MSHEQNNPGSMNDQQKKNQGQQSGQQQGGTQQGGQQSGSQQNKPPGTTEQEKHPGQKKSA